MARRPGSLHLDGALAIVAGLWGLVLLAAAGGPVEAVICVGCDPWPPLWQSTFSYPVSIAVICSSALGLYFVTGRRRPLGGGVMIAGGLFCVGEWLASVLWSGTPIFKELVVLVVMERYLFLVWGPAFLLLTGGGYGVVNGRKSQPRGMSQAVPSLRVRA